ncbi:MAG: hypothetical protein Q7S22_04525 [Candidatus Micrarchaeota archaeon]|nr:hypothetical protein [Candidatus Micrarchaeota archaeon]
MHRLHDSKGKNILTRRSLSSRPLRTVIAATTALLLAAPPVFANVNTKQPTSKTEIKKNLTDRELAKIFQVVIDELKAGREQVLAKELNISPNANSIGRGIYSMQGIIVNMLPSLDGVAKAKVVKIIGATASLLAIIGSKISDEAMAKGIEITGGRVLLSVMKKAYGIENPDPEKLKEILESHLNPNELAGALQWYSDRLRVVTILLVTKPQVILELPLVGETESTLAPLYNAVLTTIQTTIRENQSTLQLLDAAPEAPRNSQE